MIVDKEFDDLCKEVQSCMLCPRMFDSARVLNRSVGSLHSEIMFVGEAPGRLGADGTGIPFHGDKAGHNFEELLYFAGINRAEIFITNSVLCNPRDENGNNATPNFQELTNCSQYLKNQIDLINPKIIVTLGAKALESMNLIQKHNFTLKTHVRSANKWYNRILIPLYHPGQRAMLHRSFANQRSDYQFIAENYKRIDNAKKKVYGNISNDLKSLIKYILKSNSGISYFALHKLFYLIELHSIKKFGSRLTSTYLVRQKDGPYFTDLHLFKLKKEIPEIQIKNIKGSIYLNYKPLSLFESEEVIEPKIKTIINDVLKKYGSKNNQELKSIVYLSKPMRTILKFEKEELINFYNSPIDLFQE